MFWAAETSAATASQPSAHHHWHSANSPERRTNNSATAANRCAIAVDSSRVASPITSMRSKSDTHSNIRSTMPQPPDTLSTRRRSALQLGVPVEQRGVVDCALFTYLCAIGALEKLFDRHLKLLARASAIPRRELCV